jgi:DNA-binding MarR family transcriptional regulator
MSTMMPDTVDKVNQRGAQPSALDLMHTLMHQIKRRMQQATQAASEAEGIALAPMEARTLGFYARHPGATAQDLVEHAGRDKAQVARLVKSLVERGLLATATDPQDRRRQTLQLTAAGRRFERRMAVARQQVERAVIAGISADDLVVLQRCLRQMLAEI